MSKAIRKPGKQAAAKGKPTPESPAVRPGPTYRSRPVRREFAVAIVDECERLHGFGLTLDKVLDQLVQEFARFRNDAVDERVRLDGKKDGDAFREVCAEYALEHEDQVVWEGNRVLAVVRVDAKGRRLEVVRFDGPDTAPTGRMRDYDGREYDEDELVDEDDAN